jgi:hypothetical protein
MNLWIIAVFLSRIIQFKSQMLSIMW